MLPPIGQVVLVDPPFFAAEVEVTQSYLMGIVAEASASRFPDPVRLASNEELMQMLIGPVKSNLKDLMKLGNGAVASHEQTTPDLRTDLSYPNAQLVDLNLVSVLPILLLSRSALLA